jgi:hypothetical protein
MKDDIFTGLVFASNLKKSENLLMAILMLSNGKISPHQAMLYSALPEDKVIEKKNTKPRINGTEQSVDSFAKSNLDKQVPLKENEKVPLFNNSFFAGTSILLISKNRLEKTLLTIEAVKRGVKKGVFKKICFLNIEHLDEAYRPYYENAFTEVKSRLIFKSEWEQYLADAEDLANTKASSFAALAVEDPFVKNVLKALKIQKTILKGMKTLPERPFKIVVFCRLLKELIEEDTDCIVVDSTSEIFSNSATRDVLNAVFQLPRQAGVTIFALDNFNKKGEIPGVEAMKSQFYSTYIMDVVNKKNVCDDEPLLKITVANFQHPEPEHDFILKRNKVSDYETTYEVITDDDDSITVISPLKKLTIPEAIKTYCDGMKGTDVSFEELFSHINDAGITDNRDSVCNTLRKLQINGLVKNLDGHWGKIGIIRKKK